MPSLLDAIQRNTQPQQVGEQDETGKLATLLRAKSGKAVSGAAPTSSLGEQQQNVQTNQQLGQVAQQGQAQQTGLQAANTAQNAEMATQKSAIAQQNRFNTVQNKMDTSRLLDQYAQDKGNLSLAQDKAKAAQVGFNLRMQNQQYVDQLQREGNQARLNNDLNFKTELAKQTFGDNEDLFKKQLAGKSILDMSQQDFGKTLGTMTADQAYQVFHNAMNTDKERAMYTGIGDIVSTGAGAAATVASRTPASTSSNPTSTGSITPQSTSNATGASRFNASQGG